MASRCVLAETSRPLDVPAQGSAVDVCSYGSRLIAGTTRATNTAANRKPIRLVSHYRAKGYWVVSSSITDSIIDLSCNFPTALFQRTCISKRSTVPSCFTLSCMGFVGSRAIYFWYGKRRRRCHGTGSEQQANETGSGKGWRQLFLVFLGPVTARGELIPKSLLPPESQRTRSLRRPVAVADPALLLLSFHEQMRKLFNTQPSGES